MSLSEKTSERKFSVRLSALSENVLLAAIVICFVILHILAGTILSSGHQTDAVTSSESAGPTSGD